MCTQTLEKIKVKPKPITFDRDLVCDENSKKPRIFEPQPNFTG